MKYSPSQPPDKGLACNASSGLFVAMCQNVALDAQSSNGQVSTPVHNHDTWAVAVGFDGQELNKFVDRTEDGVTQTSEHMVEAGTGVATLPDDLHSIHIDGATRRGRSSTASAVFAKPART